MRRCLGPWRRGAGTYLQRSSSPTAVQGSRTPVAIVTAARSECPAWSTRWKTRSNMGSGEGCQNGGGNASLAAARLKGRPPGSCGQPRLAEHPSWPSPAPAPLVNGPGDGREPASAMGASRWGQYVARSRLVRSSTQLRKVCCAVATSTPAFSPPGSNVPRHRLVVAMIERAKKCRSHSTKWAQWQSAT